MARFSLKELFIGMTLFAIGVTMLNYVFSAEPNLAPGVVVLFGGGTLIGAGVATPLKHPWIGALVAFVVLFVVMLIMQRF